LCDESRTLQYLEMLGHGWRADRERGSQFGDGCLTQSESREDGAASGIGGRSQTVSRRRA
jgi:hypothetical protein